MSGQAEVIVPWPGIRGDDPWSGTQQAEARGRSAGYESRSAREPSPDHLGEVRPAAGARSAPSAEGRFRGSLFRWLREARTFRAPGRRAASAGQGRTAASGRWRKGGAGVRAGKVVLGWPRDGVPQGRGQAARGVWRPGAPRWVPRGGKQALSRKRGLGLIPSGQGSGGLDGRGRGAERGSGSLLAVAASLGLIGFALVGVWVVAWFTCLHRADQVADLASSAGAEAFLAGGDPCGVAARVAQANSARLTSCEAGGDLARFVVKVEVAVPLRPRPPGSPEEVSSRAAAGVAP